MKNEKRWNESRTFWTSSWYLTYILNKLIFSLHHQPGHGRHREKRRKRWFLWLVQPLCVYLYLLFNPQPELFCLNKQSQRFFPPSLNFDMTKSLNWNETYQIIFSQLFNWKNNLGQQWDNEWYLFQLKVQLRKGWLSYWVRFKNIN